MGDGGRCGDRGELFVAGLSVSATSDGLECEAFVYGIHSVFTCGIRLYVGGQELESHLVFMIDTSNDGCLFFVPRGCIRGLITPQSRGAV